MMKIIVFILCLVFIVVLVGSFVLGLVFDKKKIAGGSLWCFAVLLAIPLMFLALIYWLDTPVTESVEMASSVLTDYVKDGSTTPEEYTIRAEEATALTPAVYSYCFINAEGKVMKAEADQNLSQVVYAGCEPRVEIYKVNLVHRLTKKPAGSGLHYVFYLNNEYDMYPLPDSFG